MKVKKALPFILLLVLAVVTIAIRRCNNLPQTGVNNRNQRTTAPSASQPGSQSRGLDRSAKLFFTKHARCRMQCRRITQAEVKDIFARGEINYRKSDLDDPQGPAYAVEGVTRDRQRVRIIFAPKQRHTSVVTVIDLDRDYDCNCN